MNISATNKIDKSKLMKRAWKIFFNQPLNNPNNKTYSECLKESWKITKNEINMDFDTIYKNNYDRILMTVKKQVKDTNTAEEITSNVFLKFYKNFQAGKFDVSKSAINTYLNVIKKTVLIDYFRSENKISKYSNSISNYVNENGQETFYVPSGSTANQEVETDETIKIINDIVNNKLSSLQKEIYSLYFVSEYSYKDVSDTLNIPLGTVKANISRIREALQNTYKIQKLRFA